VRVAHRHLHGLVAEQLGDGPQRGPAHHQPGRERVPQVVPREVLDLGELQGGVEAVLDVLHGLADLRPRRVRKHVRGLGLPRRMELFERAFGGQVERDRERTSALGPWNPHDAVGEVDLIPPQVEETPAP